MLSENPVAKLKEAVQFLAGKRSLGSHSALSVPRATAMLNNALDELETLRASAERLCIRCQVVLPPTAVACSQCGGETVGHQDLRYRSVLESSNLKAQQLKELQERNEYLEDLVRQLSQLES